jgi:hypothetical protein
VWLLQSACFAALDPIIATFRVMPRVLPSTVVMCVFSVIINPGRIMLVHLVVSLLCVGELQLYNMV